MVSKSVVDDYAYIASRLREIDGDWESSTGDALDKIGAEVGIYRNNPSETDESMREKIRPRMLGLKKTAP